MRLELTLPEESMSAADPPTPKPGDAKSSASKTADARPFKPRRRSRWRRVIVVLFVVTLVFGAVHVTLALRPNALKERVEASLQEYLAYPFDIGSVEWLGFGDGIRIHDLEIHSPSGSIYENVIEIPALDLKLDWWNAVFQGAPLRSVAIRDPRVYVEIDPRDNTIPLGQILNPLPPTPPDQVPPALPSILVENLEVHSCPVTLYHLSEPIRVERFRFDLLENRRYSFAGTARHPSFRQIRLQGSGHRYERSFTGKLEVSELDLDAIRSNLAPAFVPSWEAYSPKGKASAELSFRARDGRLTSWNSTLSIQNGSLRLEQPAVVLEAVSGEVHVTPAILEPSVAKALGDDYEPDLSPAFLDVVELRGRAWGGRASVTGHVEFDRYMLADSQLLLELEGIPLDQNIRKFLSTTEFKWLDSPDTRGRFDLTLDVRGPTGEDVEVTRIRLRDARFVYDKLPYPVENVEGELTSDEGYYRLDVTGRFGPASFELAGGGHWEPPLPLNVDLTIRDLPIDATLRSALPAVAQDIWDQYSPTGTGIVRVGFNREPEERQGPLDIEVEVAGGTFQYHRFQYPLEGVSGRVRFESDVVWDEAVNGDVAAGTQPSLVPSLVPRRLEFLDLVAHQGDSRARLDDGYFNFPKGPEASGRLNLPIVAENLIIDETLIRALPNDLPDLIRSFNVVGSPKVEVRVFHRDDGVLDLSVIGTLNDPTSIRFKHLPYPVQFDQGSFDFYLSTGDVRIRDFRTPDTFSPKLSVSGHHRATTFDGRQHLTLKFNLEPDQSGRGLDVGSKTFIESMPPGVKRLLETLEVEAEATGKLVVDYKFGLREGEISRQEVIYEGDVVVRNGKFDFGLQLSEVQAAIKLYGEANTRKNAPHFFRAQVSRGEFKFSRFRLNDVVADITFGRVHDIIHDARLNPSERSVHYRPSQAFLDRLVPAQVANSLQIYLQRANLYGGPVQGFLYLDPQRRDFMGEFDCKEVDVSLAAPSLFNTDSKAKGKTRGQVKFNGDLDDPANLKGDGWFRIEEGQLTKLPILQTFLTHVVFGFFGLDPKLRVVTEVRARFVIQNQRFVFPDFEDFVLIAPSTRAVATGYMDFNQRVSLRLENRGSIWGIWLISPAVDRLTGVTLKGQLDELQVIE